MTKKRPSPLDLEIFAALDAGAQSTTAIAVRVRRGVAHIGGKLTGFARLGFVEKVQERRALGRGRGWTSPLWRATPAGRAYAHCPNKIVREAAR